MITVRALILLLLLAAMTPVTTTAQSAAPVDLAAIPASPLDVAESGYLLEGGGYLTDPSGAASLNATLGFGEAFPQDGWRQAYMHRLILLADTHDPGSDLLADIVTVVQQYESPDAAEDAFTALDSQLADNGDAEDTEPDAPTYRLVIESGDALASLIRVETVVIQVVTTDFTGRPDPEDHAATVTTTRERANRAYGGDARQLGLRAIRLDDMKQLTFADMPEAHQHYLTDAGAWLPAIGYPDPEANVGDLGLVEAFEAQSVVTFNSGDTVMAQAWLGQFADADMAAAFARSPDLAAIPTPMFADGGPGRIQGQLGDGSRYSGYRAVVAAGDTVAIVALIGTGSTIIAETAVEVLAEEQRACLAASVCEPISLGNLMHVGGTVTPTAAMPDGVYQSPDFGWSLDYGALEWEATAIGPGDAIELRQGRSLAIVESVVDRHGEPQSCILESARLLQEFEERAVITLGSDVEGEEPAGSEDGHAWAIYTVEPLQEERADQEYTIRYDCYTLVAGEASLVVSHTAPRDLWQTEASKGDALRASIEFTEVAAETSDVGDDTVRMMTAVILRPWIDRAA